MQVSVLWFWAQLLRSSFRLVNLKSFPHQTLFWQPRPPSPRPKLSSFCFFSMELSPVKVTEIGQIYILLTLKRSLKFAVTEKHLEILVLSTSIFYPLERLLSFDSPGKNQTWKTLDIYLFLSHFGFSFLRLSIQFAEICFGRICIRSDLQMSLFAFGLSFRLINLEINLVHDQMESTRT